MTAENDAKQVEQKIVLLRELRRQGKVEYPVYAKAVVTLCLTYTRIGLLQDAVDLLRGLSTAYFEEDQLGQMMADEKYCAIAIEVAEAVHGFVQIPVTMAAGEA